MTLGGQTYWMACSICACLPRASSASASSTRGSGAREMSVLMREASSVAAVSAALEEAAEGVEEDDEDEEDEEARRVRHRLRRSLSCRIRSACMQ